MKVRCTTIVLVLVLVGYLATGLIAPPLARKACVTQANRLYSQALASEERRRNMLKQFGEDAGKSHPIANPHGPWVRTGRAIPLLPGVLLLRNEYQIGPLYGKGQVTCFLFYGFGVCRLFEMTTWIS